MMIIIILLVKLNDDQDDDQDDDDDDNGSETEALTLLYDFYRFIAFKSILEAISSAIKRLLNQFFLIRF